jgi:iduronate 2-sulfatase
LGLDKDSVNLSVVFYLGWVLQRIPDFWFVRLGEFMTRLKLWDFCPGLLLGTLVCWVAAGIQASERLNVLLILVDDLRPELGCYGADHIDTPHLDRLASQGILFTRHYVQAPTCGASRYALLTGCYGVYSNQALFQRAASQQRGEAVPISMPEWFRSQGYTTVSVGKVSHHPGGLGGADWNDPQQLEMPDAWDEHLQPVGVWRHPRGIMHGLANGEIRIQPNQTPLFQSAEGDDASYPDGLIAEEAVRQLQRLRLMQRAGQGRSQPFLLAVGLIRPHLPFGAPARYLEPYRARQFPPIPFPDPPTGRTTWHRSAEFMSYGRGGRDPNQDPEFAEEVRRHYAACVTYADAQIGRILDCLRQQGGWDNTVVMLWGDHGFHLGEHAIWGKHSLFEESVRSPLILYHPGLSGPGEQTDFIAQSIDLFPTLCDISNIQTPATVQGVSLLPVLREPGLKGGAAISYLPNAHSLRTDQYRLIEHRDGFCELYDHWGTARETENLAEQLPELLGELRQELARRWPIPKD